MISILVTAFCSKNKTLAIFKQFDFLIEQVPLNRLPTIWNTILSFYKPSCRFINISENILKRIMARALLFFLYFLLRSVINQNLLFAHHKQRCKQKRIKVPQESQEPKAVATLENGKVTLLKSMTMPTYFFIRMRVFCKFYIISMKILYLHGYRHTTDQHHEIDTVTKWVWHALRNILSNVALIVKNKSILFESLCFA